MLAKRRAQKGIFHAWREWCWDKYQVIAASLLMVAAAPVLSADDQASSQAIDHCLPSGERVPICRFSAPEDLEVLPLSDQLVISEYGGLEGETGRLVAFDVRSGRVYPLFPKPQLTAERAVWGDRDCKKPTAAEFSPHGIHLSRRFEGQWQLLVVNHAARESVQFFQVQRAKFGRYELHWRGCVELPEEAHLNDVVALPGGGFLVSHMFNKHDDKAMQRAIAGRGRGGKLWHWDPFQGLKVVPNSRVPFANGVQLSADGRRIFLNVYLPGFVRVIDRASGDIIKDIPVPQPDNSNWLPDGRLLVASHTGGVDQTLACSRSMRACPLAFQLVAIDPLSLRHEAVFQQQGAPMGAGTAVQAVGEHWYIGSFIGDRLLRIPAVKKPDAAVTSAD